MAWLGQKLSCKSGIAGIFSPPSGVGESSGRFRREANDRPLNVALCLPARWLSHLQARIGQGEPR